MDGPMKTINKSGAKYAEQCQIEVKKRLATLIKNLGFRIEIGSERRFRGYVRVKFTVGLRF